MVASRAEPAVADLALRAGRRGRGAATPPVAQPASGWSQGAPRSCSSVTTGSSSTGSSTRRTGGSAQPSWCAPWCPGRDPARAWSVPPLRDVANGVVTVSGTSSPTTDPPEADLAVLIGPAQAGAERRASSRFGSIRVGTRRGRNPHPGVATPVRTDRSRRARGRVVAACVDRWGGEQMVERVRATGAVPRRQRWRGPTKAVGVARRRRDRRPVRAERGCRRRGRGRDDALRRRRCSELQRRRHGHLRRALLHDQEGSERGRSGSDGRRRVGHVRR